MFATELVLFYSIVIGQRFGRGVYLNQQRTASERVVGGGEPSCLKNFRLSAQSGFKKEFVRTLLHCPVFDFFFFLS